MDLELKGKCALVTGASRGLGFATAKILALEGASVAINSRDAGHLQTAADQILAETGKTVVTIVGDLGEPDGPAKVVNETIAKLEKLDILISNAGGPPPGSIDEMDDAAWNSAVELTLMSHVRLIRSALPYLKISPSASVLTVTSYSVKQPIPNLILSNSIRAATAALTKSLALDLAQTGIRFNSILPGWTKTERVEKLMRNRAQKNTSSIEVEFTRQSSEIPLGRMAEPDEFARAAVFLVSPAASYITGVLLAVDGGISRGLL